MIIPVVGKQISFYNNSTKQTVNFHGRTHFDGVREFAEWCAQNGMNSEDIWNFTRLLEV